MQKEIGLNQKEIDRMKSLIKSFAGEFNKAAITQEDLAREIKAVRQAR